MSNSRENKPVIPVITGPTASGKTGVALRLLEQFSDIPIISADSRQIYKYLNIGTDKPEVSLLQKYEFHLVDFVEPGDRYTAFDFADDARRLIGSALAGNKIPLICGGTGLYLRALTEGIVEIPDDDLSIRTRLEEDAVEKGPEYLFERLRAVDPLEARKTHPHNIKRIIRALEIFELTGRSKSAIIAAGNKKYDDYLYRILCLLPPREVLYSKINKRVDEMIAGGLVEEVEDLIKMGRRPNVEKVNVIGYAELFRYFDNELSLDSAVNLIKQNSRRFAKRQITWFRGMDDIEYMSGADETYEVVKAIFENREK
ncbi:MAG: tRNA (adenosine(37)-N6)-dimethylallyltransferase MiaA [candidate division Zixibacteria bacterium HGW-Zixibacteria-1]|nr:MAG: tRNA (adenosine(37)-N6)-dimethylallyltransferase MiaA [candidate division Zixibacteria bacterium HGW-Zixibacteria-1]